MVRYPIIRSETFSRGLHEDTNIELHGELFLVLASTDNKCWNLGSAQREGDKLLQKNLGQIRSSKVEGSR